MKIDFIHPAHYRDDGTLVQAKRVYDRLDAYLPHLGPLVLAALTPDRHQVRYIEEYHQDVDLDTDADVIALSAQIMQFDRAVHLSAQFRRRGKTVVLGGYLPSLVPSKLDGYFDSIVVGEGDELWPKVLSDIERGTLSPVYRSPGPVDVSNLPVPRYDLLKRGRLTVYPVQATRGCPFKCSYCSIAAVYNGGYRKRPIEHILRDLDATGSRNINFCDDNLCEDVKFSARLFDAMAGTKVRWGTQTTINVARHPELLRKARKAGCRLMALGVETIDMGNLESVDKTFHQVDLYAQGFQRLIDAGISPHALIIFGLPQDDTDTFARTVEYLENLNVPIAQFFIMTPYPGTPNGDRMWQNNLVFDERLSRLREPYVVYEPEKLSPHQLQTGWWQAVSDFYSLKSITKRLILNKRPANRWLNLGQNLLYWSKIKRGVHPVYFGA